MNFVRRLSTCAPLCAQVTITHDLHQIVKHIRPEKLPVFSPQRTCDLVALPKINPQWLTVSNRPFAELLDQLPEEKRRLFTVDFYPRSEAIKVILQDTINSVRRHEHDKKSLEYRIAWKTIQIRNIQYLIEMEQQTFRNKKVRHLLKEMVDKRKKYLTILRRKDYRCFEWLLDVLGILYRPNAVHVKIERKASVTLMVNMMCEEIRQNRMREYQELLESEKLPFLKEKLETLREIESEELSINMSSSVDQEIKDTVRRIALISPDNLLSNQE